MLFSASSGKIVFIGRLCFMFSERPHRTSHKKRCYTQRGAIHERHHPLTILIRPLTQGTLIFPCPLTINQPVGVLCLRACSNPSSRSIWLLPKSTLSVLPAAPRHDFKFTSLCHLLLVPPCIRPCAVHFCLMPFLLLVLLWVHPAAPSVRRARRTQASCSSLWSSSPRRTRMPNRSGRGETSPTRTPTFPRRRGA